MWLAQGHTAKQDFENSNSDHTLNLYSCLQMKNKVLGVLRHLLTNESSAVNGYRENESPNSWLKNTIIHTYI